MLILRSMNICCIYHLTISLLSDDIIQHVVRREDKGGKGYVDFLIKLLKSGYPAIIMELARLSHQWQNQVTIVYSETDHKKHTCIIEVYQKKVMVILMISFSMKTIIK